MTDARFEDAEEGPLRLSAFDAEGLAVISTLVQDAVFPITEMTYAKPRRRWWSYPAQLLQTIAIPVDILSGPFIIGYDALFGARQIGP